MRPKEATVVQSYSEDGIGQGYIMLRYIMLCYAILCYIISCHVTS